MRKYQHIALYCAWSIACAPASAQRALLLTANEWQPYTGSDLVQQGLATQIVRTALQRAGYRVEIRFSNWPRALQTIYAGTADGVVAVWNTNARAQRLLFSDSYLSNHMALLSLQPRYRQVRTITELHGVRVGVGRDYDYSEEFLAARGIIREPVDHAAQNLQKLLLGRVDVVIEDRLIAEYTIQQGSAKNPGLARILFSNQDLFVLPLYLGIRKDAIDAPTIIRDFNRELAAMKKDGSLRALLH
ncbi:MAG: transporter substrate-binding domain-containing protein [Sphingomonadaceae bacterium]